MQTDTLSTTDDIDCTPFQQFSVDFEKTNQFSPLFLNYIRQQKETKPFYNHFPTIEAFGKQIAEKSAQFGQAQRDMLVAQLQKQYAHITNGPEAQITSLGKKNTFTVTTGHQLNIFSGPLYFIYKIVSTINLAKKLQEKYPDNHFVPVYWMATEDHDFAEISYFNLFGKKYTWEREASGAVGHLSTEGLKELIEAVGEVPDFFKEAYTTGKNLADATRHYVNHLFGQYGLVVLDADDAALKQALVPVMKDDLLEHSAKLAVEQTDKAFEEAGYKTQVYARPINFFYLNKGIRERIEWNGEQFDVLNTAISFSKEEMMQELEAHPERLSPNVILRPLYQEMILPNLAYLGGPAEVGYWLQLKGVFDHFNTAFPLLMPRNFALVVNGGNAKKYEKLGFAPEELFLEEHELRQLFLERNSDNAIDLASEIAGLEELFNAIAAKASAVDASLTGFVGSEHQKALKSVQNIEKRIKKSEERNQETSIKQVQSLKDRLFPNNTPQERTDNLMNIYLNDEQFIERLLLAFDPLSYNMNVLVG